MSTSHGLPSGRTETGARLGWPVLVVAFFVMAFGFALRNAFSVFYPAIVEDYGWTRGNTAMMFSLSILIYGLFSPVAGGLVDRYKPQYLVACGAIALGGGFALCGFGTAEWQFYLLFGVVAAVGVSFVGVTALGAVVTPWFPNHSGMVFGVLSAGFGVSLVSATVVQYLISTEGWRNAYFIIGLSFIVVMTPLVLLFIRRAPRRAPAASPAGEAPGSAPASGWHASEWTLKRAVRTPQFWLLAFAGFFQVGVAEKIAIAHQVYFFRDAGYSPMAAAAVYGVFGGAFVVGNLVSSLSDRTGRERLYLPSCGLSLASACLLFFIRDASQPWLAYLFAAGFGVGIGILPPVLFAAVADLFHGKAYGAIQGTVMVLVSAGGAISPWLSGYLFDITGTYRLMLFMLVGSLILCGFLVRIAAPGHLSPVPARARRQTT